MAERKSNKRATANAPKTSRSKTTKSAAKKTTQRPVATQAKSTQPKQDEVVIHRTSSGPSKSYLDTAKTYGQTAKAYVAQPKFWMWVGGVVLAILIILTIWWQWQRSYVAVVNGQYVPTTSLYEQLVANGGAQTVETLVQQQLILQQADKNNITIPEDKIQEELDRFKQTTGGDDEYRRSLREFGVSEELLRSQLKVRLSLEELLKDEIEVTEQEIEEYYEANKAEADVAGEGLEAASERIRMQLREQKLQQESASYMDSLTQGANISTHVNHTGYSFVDFLHEEVYTIPAEVWGLLTGSNQ